MGKRGTRMFESKSRADLVLAGQPSGISLSALAVRHDNVALGQSRDHPHPRQFQQLVTSLGAGRLARLPRTFARIGEIFLRLRTHRSPIGLSLVKLSSCAARCRFDPRLIRTKIDGAVHTPLTQPREVNAW